MYFYAEFMRITMVKFLTFIVLSCLVFSLKVDAQSESRFVSRTFQQAIEKQTRTFKGVPGPNYWQNSANYRIDASIDPKTATLSGSETIDYVNNSPDTLDQLVFNLYQDIFRKGNSRDWDLGSEDITNGILIKQLIINNLDVDLKNETLNKRQGTKLISKVESGILPQSTTRIKFIWEMKIPEKRQARMGKYNDSTWFVAYWYPQVAVYDDMDGWDMINYQGSVEFYNDFNDYQVSVSMPGDFVVWAGGELLNPSEVFDKQIVERINLSNKSFDIHPIVTKDDYAKNRVTKHQKTNTWKFNSTSVPDFTFGFGLGKLWDRTIVRVDSVHAKDVIINTVYSENDKFFNKVSGFAQTSIRYMSFVFPGMPFPYPQVTVFCNGRINGGMESPMMANDGAPADEAATFGLTLHEISHNYFPFFMGTNEKKYAFMDEGWASLFPTKLTDSLYLNHLSFKQIVKKYEDQSGFEFDTPPMVLSNLLGANYASLRLASYIRPSMAYHFLQNALGDEIFMNGLHNYMQMWAGKHPTPIDFFITMELTADQDLNWFITPWFYSFAYPDLAIRKVTKDGIIVIENVGGLPLPIELNLTFTNGSKQKIVRNASIWSAGEKSVIIEYKGDAPLMEITLGSDLIPDSNKKSNKMLFIDN